METMSIILQALAVVAIIGFGGFQARMILRVVERGEGAAEEHTEFMTAWKSQHEQTMTALKDRRDEAQNQHEQTMTALKDRRDEAQNQHEQTMTALSAQQRSLASVEELAQFALRSQSDLPS